MAFPSERPVPARLREGGGCLGPSWSAIGGPSGGGPGTRFRWGLLNNGYSYADYNPFSHVDPLGLYGINDATAGGTAMPTVDPRLTSINVRYLSLKIVDAHTSPQYAKATQISREGDTQFRGR